MGGQSTATFEIYGYNMNDTRNVAEQLAAKLRAEGKDEQALEEFEQMRKFMAPKEPRLQRYFDHGLFFGCVSNILNKTYKAR